MNADGSRGKVVDLCFKQLDGSISVLKKLRRKKYGEQIFSEGTHGARQGAPPWINCSCGQGPPPPSPRPRRRSCFTSQRRFITGAPGLDSWSSFAVRCGSASATTIVGGRLHRRWPGHHAQAEDII